MGQLRHPRVRTLEGALARAMAPPESARAAGLRHVCDETMPGIRRVRAGKGFRYVRPDGRTVGDRATLGRIRSLAIPPAWTDVWICPRDDGHVQATGRDARGRKQYRYHPTWRAVRDATKFHRMRAFGRALPRLRARVEAGLRLPGLPREKVLATVVRLLETTLIRVGNDEYARENGSFGLTTMRTRHVRVSARELRFAFRGKHGKVHRVAVSDARLAKIVRRLTELPGQDLFQYVGDDGALHAIGSEDVNDWLHEVTGERFTSKDFRTYAATMLAARALASGEAARSMAHGKRTVAAAIAEVAARLGNTPAVCRKCYVHPSVVAAYMEGALPERLTETSVLRLL